VIPYYKNHGTTPLDPLLSGPSYIDKSNTSTFFFFTPAHLYIIYTYSVKGFSYRCIPPPSIINNKKRCVIYKVYRGISLTFKEGGEKSEITREETLITI
jgi:hypothetical protein